MDIEIDVHKDVLEFNPLPPKKVWLDYMPNFIIHPIRKMFAWPGPTPLEHWHLCLVFVKQTLDELIQYYHESKTMKVLEFGYTPEKEYKPEGGDWN